MAKMLLLVQHKGAKSLMGNIWDLTLSERRPEYDSRLSQSESFPLLLVTVPAR